jgi:murein L,D-transpeptidase YafK
MLLLLSSITLAAEGCPADTSGFEADKRLEGAAVLVVLKVDRRMGLYSEGALAGCWEVGLAYDYNEGHKLVRGDLRTPEGWYRTSDKPWSQFYGAIAVHYPGVADARRGLKDGLIDQAQHDAIVEAHRLGKKPPQNTRLGGEILVHGGGGEVDWTLGCVALDNGELDTLREQLPDTMRTDMLILP